MQPVEFPEVNQRIAEQQEGYATLPVHRLQDDEGSILCCWQLSWGERFRILFTGRMWHWILTFNKPLQPQMLTVENPFPGESETT